MLHFSMYPLGLEHTGNREHMKSDQLSEESKLQTFKGRTGITGNFSYKMDSEPFLHPKFPNC